MQTEPAQPVAGKPVTFAVELSSSRPCCEMGLDFGDGGFWASPVDTACPPINPMTPGTLRYTTTHTYAEAGPYFIKFSATAFTRCSSTFEFPLGVSGFGCVAIGPLPASRGCDFPPIPAP